MGFALDARTNTSNPTSLNGSFVRAAGIGAGTVVTANLPSNLADGDIVFAWFTSSGTPGTAWSTPTGWTLAFAQKDGTSSFGGRAALFYKVWRTGDPTTVASSGPSGECHCDVIAIRSDTDGASLTVGNPPSSGFTTGYDSEGTVATTTLTMPRAQVDATARDLRLYFWRLNSGSATATPPAVTSSDANPTSQIPQQIMGVGVSGGESGIHWGLWSDPSGTDAGTTAWTISSGKYYAVSVVVHDPNATRNGMSKGEELDALAGLVPIFGTGVEHATITTSGGGNGGGIAVG